MVQRLLCDTDVAAQGCRTALWAPPSRAHLFYTNWEISCELRMWAKIWARTLENFSGENQLISKLDGRLYTFLGGPTRSHTLDIRYAPFPPYACPWNQDHSFRSKKTDMCHIRSRGTGRPKNIVPSGLTRPLPNPKCDIFVLRLSKFHCRFRCSNIASDTLPICCWRSFRTIRWENWTSGCLGCWIRCSKSV